MTFEPYDHDNSGNELRIKDDGVYVAIRGEEAWQEGEYVNRGNRTIEVRLPDDEVERFVREYAGEIDECLESHPEWREVGLDKCPVCGVTIDDE
ncbi:hypothetical protein [Natrialba taiwanensis]|uniref:Uncharacterized protein n=1 Tax=Natrialba taiwanensis DSM 12281 TaxID=1230458 RepID=L9ZY74_9EURY|nr:hypothetical protein [Natrialba taiwanensis]ELY91460.1 hypothetical protein C484_10546 [Natrialba taiwanensis DSM 12281]